MILETKGSYIDATQNVGILLIQQNVDRPEIKLCAEKTCLQFTHCVSQSRICLSTPPRHSQSWLLEGSGFARRGSENDAISE